MCQLLTSMSSDGPTPEAMTQQILSVAPLLRGQTSQSLNSAQKSQSYEAQPSHGAISNDLIDFGQLSASAPVSGQAQQQNEPGYPVKRVDTMTSDLDEFVDAEP